MATATVERTAVAECVVADPDSGERCRFDAPHLGRWHSWQGPEDLDVTISVLGQEPVQMTSSQLHAAAREALTHA